MAVREIVMYPNPGLRQTTRAVLEFDLHLARLLDDLAESMYFHKGVGLAAPQIGSDLRVAVVDVDQRQGAPRLIELVNPTVVSVSEERTEFEEGCLSFPGESELVVRPSRATVRALDRNGQPFELSAGELLGRALQHEIDHLDGVVFIDSLSRLKRSLIERRMKKRLRKLAS
jgi:peptide deformylase